MIQHHFKLNVMKQRKQRRTFLKRLAGAAGLLALASAGRATEFTGTIVGDHENTSGGFVHSVYFWLVDETMPTRGKFITELRSFIGSVDVIRTSHIGRPADTRRDVVDHSYSYCLIVTFDSKEDHDIYQEHPAHKAFIENASHLWTRVQVYDSVSCAS